MRSALLAIAILLTPATVEAGRVHSHRLLAPRARHLAAHVLQLPRQVVRQQPVRRVIRTPVRVIQRRPVFQLYQFPRQSCTNGTCR